MSRTAVIVIAIVSQPLVGIGDESIRETASQPCVPIASVTGGLQAATQQLDRLGIPRETSVIELEGVHANTKLAPEAWKRAVTHARDHTLGFRHWEIGNEFYVSIWNAGGKAFGSAADYADYVVAVSRAIKEAQPDALVGISVEPSHIQWGSVVLRDAA